MKKILFTFLHLFLIFSFTIAQTPRGFNYQGVAKNQNLTGFNNDSIQLRFTIKDKNVNGPVLYTEKGVHEPTHLAYLVLQLAPVTPFHRVVI